MYTTTSLPRWQRAIAIGAPPAVTLLFALVLYGTLERRGDSTLQVERTYARIAQLRALRTRLVDAETGTRGFVITGDESYLEPYDGAAAEIERLLAQLRERPTRDAGEQQELDTLAAVIAHRLQILDDRIATRRNAGFDAARTGLITAGGRDLMDQVRASLMRLERTEEARLVAYDAAQRRADRNVVLVFMFGVVAIIAVALFTARLFTRESESQQALNSDLEEANVQLQGQAAELESRTEEMQAQATHLEELTVELELSNDELNRARHFAEQRSTEAESANRAKTEFLAAMSHELRTPLNAITGYVDLVELGVHGPVTELQRNALERVRHNAQHLLVLINDILNFAKVEAGNIELRMEPIRLEPLLHDTQQLVELLVSAKGLHFEIQPVHANAAVRGDTDRIRQILFNLLSNAVKFTEPGGRVVVSADTYADSVHIKVRDNGSGIPAEMHERIFDPFVQLQRGPGGGLTEGVGLGLSISRDLARAMGGELMVDSRPGFGATFTLSLPRATVPAELAAADAPPYAI